MSITVNEFKTKFPQFAAVPTDSVQESIDEAVIILNETYWGTKYDLGLMYLTAHLLTLAQNAENGNSGSAGQVSGKAVDGTSVNYAVPIPDNSGDAFYSSTYYGQRYLTLRRYLGVPASTV